MPVILRISKLYKKIFSFTKSGLINEIKVLADAGACVEQIRVHDLRYSHASLLINQGCDALMLVDRLGHEKVSTTLNTYSHLFPNKQQELVDNLEQLAAAASVTPTPEPPDGNPLLEASNLPYGLAPLTKNKTSAKIIQMPQRKII